MVGLFAHGHQALPLRYDLCSEDRNIVQITSLEKIDNIAVHVSYLNL